MSVEDQEVDSMLGMEELLEQMEPIRTLRRGEVVEGVVMRVDSDGIFVNIGHKTEGIVPIGEMRTLDTKNLSAIEEGSQVLTLVLKPETAEGSALLSIDKAVGEQGWRSIQKSFESDETVQATVSSFNRGGVVVNVEGVQGFIPMSQLISVSRENFKRKQDEDGTEADTEVFDEADIGRVLDVKVLEVNRLRNRAIFSERQAVQEKRNAQKARLIEELVVGDVRKGKVTGISSFGAFVDLGGADGLIHISEMSWNLVDSPEEVVSIGEELDVYILRVDSENMKIALSLRRLEAEPWQTISERYQVGDIVDATVTKLANFGSFARLEGSVEGLIHITELASRAINHPREVVSEGDPVRVKILRIEPERRRLGLSLRQAEEELG